MGAALGNRRRAPGSDRDGRPVTQTPRTNWTAVAFGLSLAVLAAYQQFKLPPVLPEMLDRYGYGPLMAAAFMSVFALFGLLFSVKIGALLERGGLYPAILTAAALFAGGCLVALARPETGWFVLTARGLESAAFTILALIGPALCTRNAAQHHLPIAAALIATWIPAGGLLANGLALMAPTAETWRFLWWAGIAVSALMAIWTMVLRRSGRVDFHMAPPDGGSSRPPRRIAGLLYLAAAIFTLWSWQYFSYMTWLPEYLVRQLSISPDFAILGYTIPVAMVMLFCLVAAPILRRGVPITALLAAALCLQAAVWALVPVTGAGLDGLVSLLAYGVGAGLTASCLFAMPGVILGTARTGTRAFGILVTGRNLGVLIGPVFVAVLVQATGSWQMAGPLLAGVTGANAVLAILLGRMLRAAGQGTSR